MHIDKLSIEELRLLVLLYKTHSLKDSAVRLNVSTPTASRMLARLRALWRMNFSFEALRP